MTIDLTPIAYVIGFIISILTLWGIVVKPFKDSLSENAKVMASLDKTVSRLQGDLEESKKDMATLHTMYDRLDAKVDKNCEDIIKHEERINALFKRG